MMILFCRFMYPLRQSHGLGRYYLHAHKCQLLASIPNQSRKLHLFFCTWHSINSILLRYILAVILHKFLILLGSLGQMSMDVLMAAHYAQVTVQLKIIKSNLQNLCNSDQTLTSARYGGTSLQYVDDLEIKDRFVKYVKRYRKVMW